MNNNGVLFPTMKAAHINWLAENKSISLLL
jgi:hypothetical protein